MFYNVNAMQFFYISWVNNIVTKIAMLSEIISPDHLD